MTISLPQLLRNSPYEAVIPERMVWTSSSLKMFRNCPRKFFWKYLMRLAGRVQDKHLVIGGGFHETIGRWYWCRNSSMGKIARKMAARMWASIEANQPLYDQSDFDYLTTMMRTFVGMMVGYAKIYSQDRLEWYIERDCIERQFLVNMGEFDVAGKVDLLMRKDRKRTRRTLVEHKTASKINESYTGRLPLDTQIRTYVFGAQEGFGVPVDTVLYDVVKKSKLRRRSNETQEEFNDRIAESYVSSPEKNFYREPIEFKPEYIEALKYDIYNTNRKFQELIAPAKNSKTARHADIARLFGIDVPDPKDPRSWEPNDDTCNDYFRLCDYHELCIGGLDRMSARQFDQRTSLHQELEADDGD